MHQIPGLVPSDQELFVYFDLFFKESEKYFWWFLARQKQKKSGTTGARFRAQKMVTDFAPRKRSP
jgi:hypothetical protein